MNIELRHIRKEYNPKKIPLKDVNATIHPGDIISIIGPSGTGKSTLLRCINMLATPTSGQIIVDGHDITKPDTDIDAVRRKIGMVFQNYNLYEHLTVVENVMLAQTSLLGRSREEARERSMKLLKKVGMDNRALKYPSQLSGGQKQRAAIARTLAMDPEVILFDEPTSALDPLMVAEVEKVIEKLSREGTTMLIVTHSMHFARRISNRIFYMDEGVIYEDGSPSQIFEHPLRPKTRQFLFNEYNLEIYIPVEGFNHDDVNVAFENFAVKHSLGARTVFRMQLVFEELCVAMYHCQQKPGEFIHANLFFDEKRDQLVLTIRHNVSACHGEYEKDPIVQKLVLGLADSVDVVEPKDIGDGATDEIVIEF